jgi:hypothetical protein
MELGDVSPYLKETATGFCHGPCESGPRFGIVIAQPLSALVPPPPDLYTGGPRSVTGLMACRSARRTEAPCVLVGRRACSQAVDKVR